jgi:hypothetical protein
MNIVKNIEQYDINSIYFCEPIKNTIMNEGMFIRILYSTPNFILNGVNLLLDLHDVNVEKYYNKYKCSFNLNYHRELIENIRMIEESILKRVNLKNKITSHKIYDQLKNGNIKLFSETMTFDKSTNHLFMLKISGIWETETQIGLTFKFIKINHL